MATRKTIADLTERTTAEFDGTELIEVLPTSTGVSQKADAVDVLTNLDHTFTGDNTFTGSNTYSGTENVTGTLQLDGTNIVEEFQRFTMEEKYSLGEVFTLMDYREPSAWDANNPRDYFAGLNLDAIDGHTDISDTNWPDLGPYFRGVKAAYREGTASEKTAFDVTEYSISSNVVTLTLGSSSSDPEQFILDDLLEDEAVHRSFTDWRPIELPTAIDGTIDAGVYAITEIDTANRYVKFDYTNADVSTTSVTATAEFPLHKIPGESAKARVFEVSGRVLVAANDVDDKYVSGLRRRDEMQRITGRFYSANRAIDNTLSEGAFDSIDLAGDVSTQMDGDGQQNTDENLFDSDNSPDARTGDKTNPRALAAHAYIWGRRYTA